MKTYFWLYLIVGFLGLPGVSLAQTVIVTNHSFAASAHGCLGE